MQEIITINVQPGWKDGTRITFAGKGDELPGQPPQVRDIWLSLLLLFCLANISRDAASLPNEGATPYLACLQVERKFVS